ncbi:ribonuclease R [Dongia soli]|uniref:Ribonuclease R n=1 Tax=Dongia soli TaxID=600628 RepID=A0ABU5EGY5_9PROT|nr:ribonuclease R [Dongia soli]MDY0885602.1 ribonuclease R [Dongia soli]
MSKSNSKHRSDKPARKREAEDPSAPERGAAPKGSKKAVPFPTKEQVLAFIQDQDTPVGKREIARAFNLRGADRIPLKALLKELEREGEVDRGRGRRVARSGALPEVTVLEVIGLDDDGDLWARPVDFRKDDAEPRILVIDNKRTDRPLAGGDRVLARLERKEEDLYEARPIRRLEHHAQRIVGLFERRRDGTGRLTPTDKRIKTDFNVSPHDIGPARSGDIVIAHVDPARRLGTPRARIVERVGKLGEAKSISLISIVDHGIPLDFSPAALEQAANAKGAALGQRTDLRQVPLVTIDGDDARDFDDAVFASPDENPNNPGGWRLLVAIADVAHYVRPGDPLDKAARERGNSVYFPDRVVPMLPEELSNGSCSLKPQEERPCMAVEMTINAEGKKLGHRFMRGLMRSAARLTYDQVQRAVDGQTDELTAPLVEPVIKPLYGAFRALLTARENRGTLELDIAERRVFINNEGEVERIVPRARLDSHRLIEEFMIAANVAAAESLETRRQPCMYRVHDAPDPARVDALREFLRGLDLPLAKGQVLRPKHFTALLNKAANSPYAAMINSLVLRTQTQAVYSPENLGHFGLALQRYAHFTSPIRRYADLLVHRALISGYGFGDDGLPPGAEATFPETGDHISATERRAAAAEREAIDRYTAAFLAERVGEVFAGRITSVTRFGLFISLEDTGADGLVPISTLPTDFYDHDERGHVLVGRRWGRVYQLGAPVEVRLVACVPLTGGMTLEIVGGGEISAVPAGSAETGRQEAGFGRPKRRAGEGKLAPVQLANPRGGKQVRNKSGQKKAARHGPDGSEDGARGQTRKKRGR